ncbi:hypothetical protein GCM10027080_23770 [Pedococcus soli]
MLRSRTRAAGARVDPSLATRVVSDEGVAVIGAPGLMVVVLTDDNARDTHNAPLSGETPSRP